MSNDNGKFLRGVFWALLIGSFGWASAIGWCALNANAEVRKDYIQADTEVRQELSAKLDAVLSNVIDTKTMVASYARQIDVNTKRLDKLEEKHV